jgi:hypothetical protein
VVTAAEAVDALLSSLELDAAAQAKAAIARALASKLDEAGGQESGTIAMAISGIAKELRAVLDAILESQGDDDAFTAGLFAEVGNPAKS